MERLFRIVVPIALLAAGVGLFPTPAWGLSATAADHRYSANSSWSHSSDGMRTSTGLLPELLAFKFNLAFTAFESTDVHQRIPLSARLSCYRTGRITPALYYHGNKGGESLLRSEVAWHTRTFGVAPQALSYSYGIDDERAVASRYVFGARNSLWDLSTPYGPSKEQPGTSLGSPSRDFTRTYVGSMPSTTRFFDMNRWATLPNGSANPVYGESLTAAIALCDTTLAESIEQRGWYSDFTHWSGVYGRELYRFYDHQTRAMDETAAATARVSYADAVAYRYLRDSAVCTVTAQADGTVRLRVSYRAPYTGAPLSSLRVPLSVRVDLSGSPLQGREVTASGSDGIMRIAEDIYDVEIKYAAAGSTVIFKPAEAPGYFTLEPPTYEITRDGDKVTITTQKPTRCAIFVASNELERADSADAVWRSAGSSRTHAIDLRRDLGAASVGGGVNVSGDTPVALYAGLIDRRGQSVAVKLTEPTPAVSMSSPATVVAPYGSSVVMRARLTDASATPLPSRAPYVERWDGNEWVGIAPMAPTSARPGGYELRVGAVGGRATHYRLRFDDAGGYYESKTLPVLVLPRVGISKPKASRTPRRNVPFVVSAVIRPKQTGASGANILYVYRRFRTARGYEWRLERMHTMAARQYGTYSVATKGVSIPWSGTVVFRVYHRADALNAATWSPTLSASL